MNIAVINIKDIIKYILGFIIILLTILFIINRINKEEFRNTLENVRIKTFSSNNSSFLYCLKSQLPLLANFDKKDDNNKRIISKDIIKTQLALIDSVQIKEKIKEDEDEEENQMMENNDNKMKVENTILTDIPDKMETHVISENNLNARFTDTSRDVKINNQTNIDLGEILENSNYELTNKNKVIIYHTHTCESYTPSEKFGYEMTGAYRTTDLSFSVARVGDELEELLTSFGKTVVHDKTYHDYPAYNGSYGRSLKTMNEVLEKNNDAEIMIDLHRDAVGSNSDYGPSVKIGDETCAQLMFVIGSNGSGLYHPNWSENLKFAITVQDKANEMYPRII